MYSKFLILIFVICVGRIIEENKISLSYIFIRDHFTELLYIILLECTYMFDLCLYVYVYERERKISNYLIKMIIIEIFTNAKEKRKKNIYLTNILLTKSFRCDEKHN